MCFLDLASERYSVRKYQQIPVEQEKIDSILRVAQVAPSGHNAQSARVLVINEESALEKLRRCTVCHYHAPLIFLVGYDRTVCWQREYDGKLSGEIDASIICTHMMLEAFDLGLGSVWVMNFNPYKMRQEFHIPDQIEPVALLLAGYPAEGVKPTISVFYPVDG
ncbi:nitroreductase family protein [Faecalispora jeddahensis]|uniref:nitroreductase family protein n=1 Tax=Faecalispora jeddahensis TaxID=1414721 RepID=UPI001899C5B2|nr:nitroreductase family protein [Faecalispora jeddahensis]